MNIAWTVDLETGNSIIDSEHKILIEKINHLLAACRTGAGRGTMIDTAGFLLSYTKTHFAHEEVLCKQHDPQHFPEHKKWHDEFAKKIEAVTETIFKEEPNIIMVATINQQVALLLSHIRITDRALAQCIRDKG